METFLEFRTSQFKAREASIASAVSNSKTFFFGPGKKWDYNLRNEEVGCNQQGRVEILVNEAPSIAMMP